MHAGFARTLGVCALVGLLPSPAPSEPVDLLTRGRSHADRFSAGELAEVHAVFAPELATAMPLPAFSEFRGRVVTLGPVYEVLGDALLPAPNFTEYVRWLTYGENPAPWEQMWALDPASGKVLGVQLRPAQRTYPGEHLGKAPSTPLELPFYGKWYVAESGPEASPDGHAFTRDRLFLQSFVLERGGSVHRGAGEKNDDYYAWDQIVLAPAGGRVVHAVHDVPDHAPGAWRSEDPHGNHVVIDHGNGEYSVLAHLRKGSLRVNVGDEVNAGTALAKVGNSGRSWTPHLHHHLQDGPEPGHADGIPIVYRDLEVDGRVAERAVLVRGESVVAG